MKELEWFRGIFSYSSYNINLVRLKKETQKLNWGSFGYFDNHYYQMIDNKLYFFTSRPKNGVEITYNQYENWMLGDPILNDILDDYPQVCIDHLNYEVY